MIPPTHSSRSKLQIRGDYRGDYGLGSIAGSVKADNATYVDIKESYTECPITLGSSPRAISEPYGSNAGGFIGEIIKGEFIYQNHILTRILQIQTVVVHTPRSEV